MVAASTSVQHKIPKGQRLRPAALTATSERKVAERLVKSLHLALGPVRKSVNKSVGINWEQVTNNKRKGY